MERGSTTLANDLAGRLRKRIQREELRDGAFFMTEADVAAEYEVSRTVAREAVGKLKALGILEGRKRKGLMVRHPDPLKLLSETLPSLFSSRSDWRELGMLRYVLEVGSVELAVRNATEQQIEQLGGIVKKMEVCYAEGNTEAAVEADLEFHALILNMTGSRMIEGMRQVLVDFFEQFPAIEPDATNVDRIMWEHQELCNAIREKDVERARTMIRLQSQSWFSAEAAKE